MQPLETVILRHVRREDLHLDWLVSSPRDPRGRLCTFRLPWPAARMCLPDVQPVDATVFLCRLLPPHRRAYLVHQGVLAPSPGCTWPDRGRVVRLARGVCESQMWTQTRRRVVVRWHRPRVMLDMPRGATEDEADAADRVVHTRLLVLDRMDGPWWRCRVSTCDV